MIEATITYLGLRDSSGWVEAANFDQIVGPRGALRSARENMGVRGAFGTWQHGTSLGPKRFIPLLYLAEANDMNSARDEVHRRVWSQGLVPLLVICTPDVVYVNEGYDFSHERWTSHVTCIDARVVQKQSTVINALNRLMPQRLMSSVAWRDFAINPDSRVDRRLLSTLEALSRRVAQQSGAGIKAANALIGRFLYFYILRDRGFLSDIWMSQFGPIDSFEIRSDDLTTKVVWALFDALDRLLNGTIFPMATQQREAFNDHDVRLLRNCIKLGDELQGDGLQFSFFDFDISSLQTETLSAIYEQFLKTEDSLAKRRDGVFYTPPYLADFVLDRVEDEVPLTPACKVIDCTAGSGVFVVGAYRRIIESAIGNSNVKSLSALTLRSLLVSCIFAIEKNPSAHAVATFSLYLTMLDYVDEGDIASCLEGREAVPLFPPLDRHNVICADVFSITSPKHGVRKFDVVVGNPPWQNIGEITENSQALQESLGGLVDSNEAAEYTVWWSAKQLLEPGGVMALVMPTKSLIGPSAKRFPLAISKNLEIIGVANFAHFRYELFANARQAACALLLRNTPPGAGTSLWTYSPTRAHMPGPTNSKPWALTLDHSQIQHVSQRDLVADPDAWFEAIMLRPLDRYIRRFLSDCVDVGKCLSLAQLLNAEDMDIDRGGSPAQTGLPAELHYGADKFKSNDIRKALGIVVLQSENRQTALFTDAHSASSDDTWIHSVKPEFRQRFSGNALVLPRSMQGAVYAPHPIAFNSSLNVIYFKASPKTPTEREARARFLFALGIYLQSDVVQYFYAIIGKLWILDRTRLEKNDLLTLPVPFKSLDDPFLEEYLKTPQNGRTKVVCKRFGFAGWLIRAVEEYEQFRSDFEDGGVPTTYGAAPSADALKDYKDALGFTVRPICSDLQTPLVDIRESANPEKPYVVSVLLAGQKSKTDANIDATRGVKECFEVAQFSDSALISTTLDQSVTRLEKPAEKFRWTVESAFMDGMLIMHRLMEHEHG